MTDKAMSAADSPRQKIIMGIVVLVMGFLGYQVYHMFSGGSASETQITPQGTGAAVPQGPTPQPAQLLQTGSAEKNTPLSEREMQLIKLQQETEAKYIAALNELQMLKVQKDIAETNKAIVTAKVDTVTAQKNLVDLLAPAAQPQQSYAQQAQGGITAAQGGAQEGIQQQAAPVSSYTVVSVSHLQGRWNAVMGYQGKLMNVFVGDTLPADGSKIQSIDKTGVTLKLQDGTTKRISLVTII